MNMKLMMHFGLVAGLATAMTVACAPKKDKTPIRRADGKLAKGAPSQETLLEILKLVPNYKIDDETNKSFAARLRGATAIMGESTIDKKSKLGSGNVDIVVVLKNKEEAIKASGSITSGDMTYLPVIDTCGNKTADYRIEAKCASDSCNIVLAMVSEAIKGDDGKSTDKYRDMAIVFRRADPKAEHKIAWSSNDQGKTDLTGPQDKATTAVQKASEEIAKGKALEFGKGVGKCADPKTPEADAAGDTVAPATAPTDQDSPAASAPSGTTKTDKSDVAATAANESKVKVDVTSPSADLSALDIDKKADTPAPAPTPAVAAPAPVPTPVASTPASPAAAPTQAQSLEAIANQVASVVGPEAMADKTDLIQEKIEEKLAAEKAAAEKAAGESNTTAAATENVDESQAPPPPIDESVLDAHDARVKGTGTTPAQK